MIPILYEQNENDFTHYGLGAMQDVTVAEVTEERNGLYELTLRYPVAGSLFLQLTTGKIIKAKPSENETPQLFRIYRLTTPIDGMVSVYASHISYDLSYLPVYPITKREASVSLALQLLLQESVTGFSAWTDKTLVKSFLVDTPCSIRSMLGGREGSILDIYGGEYEWDNFTVKLHSKRGKDLGVTIEYGKNLSGFEMDENVSNVYTRLLPFALKEDGDKRSLILLPEKTIPFASSQADSEKTLIKDFSMDFQEEELNEDKLRARALSFIKQTPYGKTIPSLTVSFLALSKLKNYPNILEQVSLCDELTVRHRDLGIEAKSKVIRTRYDVLNECFIEIGLGEAKSNMADKLNALENAQEKTERQVKTLPNLLAHSIKAATSLLTGQKGGYVVIHQNEETGMPYEILILDQPNIETAQNVWRWNQGGLGFSKSGYSGPYETAITADGKIVADFISTGVLSASLLKSGVISSLDGTSYWDLSSGEVVLSAYATKGALESQSITIDGIQTDLTVYNTKISQIESSHAGLSSFVSGMNKELQTVTDAQGLAEEKTIKIEESLSALSQSMEDIRFAFKDSFQGGINHIQNSSAQNGLSDDWVYSGTVEVVESTDVKNNTTADAAFVLLDNTILSQEITGLIAGNKYVLSLRAKKIGDGYSSSVRIEDGSEIKEILFDTKTDFPWQEYSLVLDHLQEKTIRIVAANRSGELYLADMMLAEGTVPHKWAPAPSEIYTSEVKIDRRGIEVKNDASSQKTIIDNKEFSGYYNEEKIFTLNKDETRTKKTTVDGELTVGKVKFVPLTEEVNGLNVVILD